MDPVEKKPHILIAEDDPSLQEMYRRKLQESGLDVTLAHNGAEAVQLAGELKPDLILMDFKMPVMDGIEALMKLRGDPATVGLRVVFFTAFGDSNVPDIDPRYAQEVGATGLIQKGIELNKLVEKIREYLKS